ncbi:MAG: hypothetical protein H7834_02070 [Magnetococcus sp. YQC-9]
MSIQCIGSVCAETIPLEFVRNSLLSDLLNLSERVFHEHETFEEIEVHRLPVRDEGQSKCDEDVRQCRMQRLLITHLDHWFNTGYQETNVFILPSALEWRKPLLIMKKGDKSIDDAFMFDLHVQEVQNDRPNQDGSVAVVERELLVRHREVVWQGTPPANATRQLEEITDPEFKDLLGNLFFAEEYHLSRVDIRVYEAWQKNSFNECHWPDNPSCPAFRLLIAIRDRFNVWNNKVYILPKAYGGWEVRSVERFQNHNNDCSYRIELNEYYLNMNHDSDDPDPLFLKRPKVVCVDLKKGYFE